MNDNIIYIYIHFIIAGLHNFEPHLAYSENTHNTMAISEPTLYVSFFYLLYEILSAVVEMHAMGVRF